MFKMTASQEVDLTFTGEDAKQNEAPIEGVKVVSGDESIVSVLERVTGGFTLVAVGKIGTVQVNYEADAKIGEEEKLIVGMDTIEVIAGEAVAIRANFGDPREQAVVPPV